MKNLLIVVLILTIHACSIQKHPDYNSIEIVTEEKRINTGESADLNTARYGIGYTNDLNNIYAANGGSTNTSYVTSIEKYNTRTNEWEILTNKSLKRRYGSLELINDKLYIFNGQNRQGAISKTEVFDLKEKTLESRKKHPDPTFYAGSASWEGQIYTFGGCFDGKFYSNKLYKYDPDSDNWTKLASMKERKQTQGEIIDGKLYVIGGYNGKISRNIDVYDIKTNKWERLMELPMGISAHSTTLIDDEIWIVGDYEKLSFIASFNPKLKKFFLYDSNMLGRRHAGCAFLAPYLYIFGGNINSAESSSLKSTQVIEFQ